MAQELTIGGRQDGDMAVLELRGDVTMYAEAELTRAYRAANERGARIILLNFANTEYINSAGIAIIISLLTEARAAGVRLAICCLSAHYQKIFRMVGLTQYADIYADEKDALASRGARQGVAQS